MSEPRSDASSLPTLDDDALHQSSGGQQLPQFGQGAPRSGPELLDRMKRQQEGARQYNKMMTEQKPPPPPSESGGGGKRCVFSDPRDPEPGCPGILY